MLDQVFRPGHRRFLLNRIRANPLGEDIGGFASYLVDRRHSRNVVLEYLQAIEHFGTWLGLQAIPTASLSERVIARFLGKHLGRCHCVLPASRTLTTLRASANHFLRFLRQQGRVHESGANASTPIDRALLDFDRHLIDTCGAAENTRIYRLRYVRQFLEHKYGRGPIRPDRIKAKDLMGFVAGRAREVKPGSAKVIACSLRSYIKFLSLKGQCQGNLANAVPAIADWRLSHIPKTMPKEDLRRFLSSIDRSTLLGCRDYSMALCLSDLGLRACEVAELRLDDIDWREGSIKIASGKTRRERMVPLPPRVGRAIADYLRRGRPTSPERRLFLTYMRRPGLPADASMVRRAMASAYNQSGAKTRWAGPHALRHTVATAMLERGTPLKEVADVLGHTSIDTAAIYAKVNLAMLSRVAMRWPGAQS